MNILYVASRFPYPPLRGDQLRAFQQLQWLAGRHRVVLLAPVDGKPAPDAMEVVGGLCQEMLLLPRSPWRGALRLTTAMRNRVPLQSLFFYQPEFGQSRGN